jgi:hypothetical protein
MTLFVFSFFGPVAVFFMSASITIEPAELNEEEGRWN